MYYIIIIFYALVLSDENQICFYSFLLRLTKKKKVTDESTSARVYRLSRENNRFTDVSVVFLFYGI